MPQKFKTTYKHKCRKARSANPLPKIKKQADTKPRTQPENTENNQNENKFMQK